MICDAVVLAAGGSSRLGRPKQLLRHDGATLLERTVATALAAHLRRIVVVLGAHADAVRASVRMPAECVENVNWQAGVASSIRVGLAALDSPDAVLLLVCDQPRVSSAHLQALVRAAEAGKIAASSYAGVIGVPAVFPKRWFGDLESLTGDRGARMLIREHADDTIVLPCPEAAFDIDTEADALVLKATPCRS
jgi:CTP:molybdopterin cytidylyltransferase MocA